MLKGNTGIVVSMLTIWPKKIVCPKCGMHG